MIIITANHTNGNTPRLTGLLVAAETVQQASCACIRYAVCTSVSGLHRKNFLCVRVADLRMPKLHERIVRNVCQRIRICVLKFDYAVMSVLTDNIAITDLRHVKKTLFK